MQLTSNPDAEVAVVNDELIQNAVCKEDVDPANANAINERDGSANFTKLKSLSLSFKNIFKLDNLITLRGLTTLKLDNNVIQEIEGIAHLTSLTWLDLSFNNISEIKGLDTLVGLKDLSLYNNNITKLENLEQLKDLQVLSIGNNSLGSTEGLLYLRCLENLQVLNLDGNPMCSDPEYRPFVLAHLDKLKYLDYALVEVAEVQLAREQYQDELEEWKEIKMIEDAAKKRAVENEEYNKKLEEANIINLETLFQDMMKEDMEIGKVQALPGLQNLIDDYAEKAKSATDEVKGKLLEKHQKIQEQRECYDMEHCNLEKESQKKSIGSIEMYHKLTKRLFKEARNMEGEEAVKPLDEAKSGNEKVAMELMEYESELVERSLELISSLELQVEKLSAESRDIATEHFRNVEELENGFFESVTQLSAHLLERLASEDMEDDDMLSDECRAIMNDRDALNNAINGSHDIHIGKLLSQEDAIRERNLATAVKIIRNIKDNEWKRNRVRVAEIIFLKEKHFKEIETLREELTRVDDDFY